MTVGNAAVQCLRVPVLGKAACGEYWSTPANPLLNLPQAPCSRLTGPDPPTAPPDGHDDVYTRVPSACQLGDLLQRHLKQPGGQQYLRPPSPQRPQVDVRTNLHPPFRRRFRFMTYTGSALQASERVQVEQGLPPFAVTAIGGCVRANQAMHCSPFPRTVLRANCYGAPGFGHMPEHLWASAPCLASRNASA